MKIKIGPYKNWIGPFQIAEKILFFIPKYDKKTGDYTEAYDKYVHGFGNFLAGGNRDGDGKDSWLMKLCLWIDSKRKRTIKVKIHKYDTWSMDHTLAYIILPMLKQLRDTKNGSHIIELEDVPESMRLTEHNEWEEQQCFDFYYEPDLQKIQCDLHDRWNWVLNEMIWTFEQIVEDNNDMQFYSGESDYISEPCGWDEEGKPTMYQLKHGPNHTQVFDVDGFQKHHERINNGLRLFGKYYQGLWD